MKLEHKSYTDKDYAVDEVYKKINANNYVEKIEKKIKKSVRKAKKPKGLIKKAKKK